MRISIVIPVYKEEAKVSGDIKAAARFFSTNGFEGQIVVVDDGSSDGTCEAAEAQREALPTGTVLCVIGNEQHRGKGHAIRTGVSRTTGEYVMFADSGCCVPYENMLRGLDMLKSGGCDIAHGSRKLEQTRIIRDQGLYRHVCSKLFHWFVILFMRVPAELTDTQCGFKVYKGDVARELYGECITDGFAFDVEIILRALREGYRIKEFAIEWSCDRDSRLSPGRSVWRILGELLAIRRALRG